MSISAFRRSRTAGSFILALLLISGCSAAPMAQPSQPEPSETPAFEGTVGVDWLRSALPDTDSEDRLVDAVFALGKFWIFINGEEPAIFSSTADPQTWETTTLTELGVSADAARSARFAASDDRVVLALSGSWNNDQTPPTPPTPIVLTTRGDEWSVAEESAALVPWTPSEVLNDKYLSYKGFTDAALYDGSLTLVSAAGWFRPFETGDSSVITMTLGADGELIRNIADRPPFGSAAQVRSHGLFDTATGMHLVTSTSPRGENSDFLVVHNSMNGAEWQSTRVGPPLMLDYVDVNTVSSWSAGDTIYIHGISSPVWDSPADDDEQFLVRSADGSTWESVEIPGSGERMRGGSDGTRDYVLAPTSFTSGDLWAESDSGEWELVSTGLYRSAFFVGYPGGLAMIDQGGIEYSGPWPG